MTTGAAENFGHVLDQASQKNGRGDAASAVAAADAYAPNASAETKKAGAEALNQSLQNSGIIPGIDIVGTLDDQNPNDSKIDVQIAPENPNGTGLTGPTNATYDADSHTLEWTRDGVLPGNQGQKETVLVNMLTGQETVEAPSADGGRRVTTRASVGDPACTTATINRDNQVAATESFGPDGTKHNREYQYANGQLSGVSVDGKALKLPPGAAVNTDPMKGTVGDVTYTEPREGVNGQVQFNLHPDGSSTMTMPGANGEPGQGRAFTVGSDNKINYNVQPGDTLWNVSKDLAQLQGKPNPSTEDVQGIVNQIGHVGQNGDPNLILAGEPITFGAATNQPTEANPKGNPQDQLDLSSLLPKTDGLGTATPPGQERFAIQNPGTTGATVNINGKDYPLGEGDPGSARVDESGVLHYNYKPQDGRGPITVEVHPDGTEVTNVGETKIFRHKAGEQPFKFTKGDATLENRDNKWWVTDGEGGWNSAGGLIRVDATGRVQYDGTGLPGMFANHYGLNVDGPPDVQISDGNSIVKIDTNK